MPARGLLNEQCSGLDHGLRCDWYDKWGGAGASFLDHTIAYEMLGQGCPSTALAFNMHASVVMPLLESAEVSNQTKRQIAEHVVQERKLIAGNFSETVTT